MTHLRQKIRMKWLHVWGLEGLKPVVVFTESFNLPQNGQIFCKAGSDVCTAKGRGWWVREHAGGSLPADATPRSANPAATCRTLARKSRESTQCWSILLHALISKGEIDTLVSLRWSSTKELSCNKDGTARLTTQHSPTWPRYAVLM